MRVFEIIARLKKRYGEVSYSQEPFKVLITTILSQRTRDENTSQASKKLFSKFGTAREIAKAPVSEIETLIRESGFYRVKAKRVKEVAKILLDRFQGKVPSNLEELLTLPGVGRKTANCVLVYGFRKFAIPVDIHVAVVSKRLGLVDNDNPTDVEKQLQEIIPKKHWREVNKLLVEFGKEICWTRNPKCDECFISDLCDYFANDHK